MPPFTSEYNIVYPFTSSYIDYNQLRSYPINAHLYEISSFSIVALEFTNALRKTVVFSVTK